MKKKRRMIFWGALAVLALFGLLAAKSEVTMAGNESTRFAVIEAVGERGGMALDGKNFRSVDKVIRDGKIYSDKPPVPAFLAGLLHQGVHRATGWTFATHYGLLIYLYNLLIFTTINLLLFVLFWRRIMPERGKFAMKALLAFSLAAGSWMLSYSVTMNNHTPTALMLFLWFLLLEREVTPLKAFGAGLAAGFAANCEIPPGAIAGLAGLPVVWCAVERKRAVAAYMAGGGLMLLLYGAVNYWGYGTVVPLYIAGSTGTFAPGWSHKNWWKYAWETLFGRRGFFAYQPLILAAIPALAGYGWGKRTAAERAAIVTTGLTILFYVVNTNEYGGWAYGFRYLIAVLPLAWLIAAEAILRLPKRRWITGVVIAAAVWGMATGVAGSYCPFQAIHEGYRSPKGEVDYEVRSSFAANVLAWSFERDAEGVPAQTLLKRVYEEGTGLRYLEEAYINTKNIDGLKKLQTYIWRCK